MSIADHAVRTRTIAFISSGAKEADEALKTLVGLYGNIAPEEADVIVALGGDGLMLQTLHRTMNAPKPIYGMNRGSVGFLMNEYSEYGLPERLAAARPSIIHPLAMRARDIYGAETIARAINEVSLRAAEQVEHDQIVPALFQRLIAEPTGGGKVGKKNPAAGAGRRNERGYEFLPFGLPGIDRDRPLSLVQADPIQALAVLIHRPAFRIEPAANRIEADHVGAELCERHTGERGRDESGPFDDAQIFEDIIHATPSPEANSTKNSRSGRAPLRRHVLVAERQVRR